MQTKTLGLLGLWVVLVSAFLIGCGGSSSDPTVGEGEGEGDADAQVDASSLFDSQTAGTVEGQVTWQGPTPVVASFRAPISPRVEQRNGSLLSWSNPNVPAIDSATHGVKNAVVYLEGVDPKRSRPWDHPQISVEISDYQFRLSKNAPGRRSAFVRRGDRVELVSRQDDFHSVQATGAAYFAAALPDRDLATNRRMTRKGLVELTSAAGCFWMRAYLFVDDHPYYTHTDDQGHFTLTQVPPGSYRLTCWLPNWHENHHDRDPETCYWMRLAFKPAVIVQQNVTVDSKGKCEAEFTLSESMFAK